MTRNLLFHTVWIAMLGCVASGDTFTHRTDGKRFHGYATQKTNREQTMVFNFEANKLETATLAEYDIVYNKEGRKNIVSIIPIQAPEILISEAVAKEVADQLVMASNNGPRMIVLDIDNPGGSGEYMKIVSSAITGTFNCPVVAYISGGKYGGAYSAAALLALSCNKIYMAPNATLGSVCPIVVPSADLPSDQSPLQLFSPPTLAAYRSYAASLARQAGRNEILATALVDREVEIVEIKNADGKQSFIDRQDRQPTETIIRSWTRVQKRDDKEPAKTTPSQVAAGLLSLTSQDALRTKMIDGISGSISDILKTLDTADAQVTENRSIDQVIKRFQVNKKTVNGAVANIEVLQKQADALQKQIQNVEEQIRTGTLTREYNRGNTGYPSENARLDSQNRRQEYDRLRDQRRNDTAYGDRNRRPYGLREGERITADVPATPVAQLVAQLNDVLNTLTREYRRVISLAQRYPGTLPPDITIPQLQQKLDANTAQQNYIRQHYYEPGMTGMTGTTR
jgi:hypothetical protein